MHCFSLSFSPKALGPYIPGLSPAFYLHNITLILPHLLKKTFPPEMKCKDQNISTCNTDIENLSQRNLGLQFTNFKVRKAFAN